MPAVKSFLRPLQVLAYRVDAEGNVNIMKMKDAMRAHHQKCCARLGAQKLLVSAQLYLQSASVLNVVSCSRSCRD